MVRFGSNARGKGVELTQTDAGLMIDAYVFLQYGVAVPKVALDIQNAIQSQITSMTDLNVVQTNVHVSGMEDDIMAREIKRSKQATKNIILATQHTVAGTTQVTPEVIEVIAQIATQEVPGVYSMRGKLSDHFTNALTKVKQSSLILKTVHIRAVPNYKV
ncbi:Asp23/Gls24 family envelope stress response protein|uniref:Asp23/Gls24 family envelope stress response protein n=1 Tax=Leuconostoc lactis TaxID=1246 RepID=A0A6L7AGR9_LEULA|nr:Asp23/Gls24 family envelope stress response protein [Leuconostoc lactis]